MTLWLSPERRRTSEMLYNRHIKNIKNMKAKTNSVPPNVRGAQVVNFSRFKEDLNSYYRIWRENNELLAEVNKINRIGTVFSTFRKCPAYETKNRTFECMVRNVQKIEKRNFKFGIILCCTKAKVNSFRPLTKEQKRKLLEAKLRFDLPEVILKKYNGSITNIPESVQNQKRIFRPHIYFDLYIEDTRELERMVFELYTEAAPQVVLEIVRACVSKAKNKIKITRLFPSLWLECEMMLNRNSSLVNKKIEYDKRAIAHDIESGILSFPECYNEGFKYGILSFNISFRPLATLNGKRVAFGRIIKGKRSFDSISHSGSFNGVLHKRIYFRDWGIMN